MNHSIHDILQKHWGFSSFRPLQEEVINSVLAGKDTLVLMPTGGGKSLCYQVPALAKDGICLVISPLIALMKDQVQNLRKKNITAFAIYSGMTRKEVVHTFKTVISSNCKFLYVSPERLESNLFKEFLPAMDINLIAVDEAHCISQWGYDFRPPYLRISKLREELPGIPLLALTASATPDVQTDICARLELQGKSGSWSIFRQSYERPNLSYSVYRVDSRISKIAEILSRVAGSAIIYCKSRKRTEEISELLRLRSITADYYHAGLAQEDRHRKQEAWISNSIRVIVCTNAFGMGIDKPDVRVVIHADPPDCLENYYQEAGRAGRDGKTSYAILLYDEPAIRELEGMAEWRYPSEAELKKVYQSVSNYLQIPSGEPEGTYYDFDLSDFLRKFKLPAPKTLSALKSLEQEGWLSFNEQVFLPATIEFTSRKEELYRFEEANPSHEPIIKTLLRTYEGIFDHPTPISELLLVKLLQVDEATIRSQLKALHQCGVLEYRPQKDQPQLYFGKRRVKVEELTIDRRAYDLRKSKFQSRIIQMIRYLREEGSCRSSFLARYLGDTQVKACGICDNCFRKKKIQITQEEFESIHHRILHSVENESLHTRDLLDRLPGVHKEKVWKVIEFLLGENKVALDELGRIGSR